VTEPADVADLYIAWQASVAAWRRALAVWQEHIGTTDIALHDRITATVIEAAATMERSRIRLSAIGFFEHSELWRELPPLDNKG
jgi:hypothetical protein